MFLEASKSRPRGPGKLPDAVGDARALAGLPKPMDVRALWRDLHGTSAFAANATLTAAANLALAALGAISGILAARLLGPDGRGELAAIQIWPSFLGGLAMLGMPEAVVYYCARSPAQAGRYLGSAIVIALLSSVPFLVAAYIMMPLLLHAQAPAIVRAGRWYLLLIPVFALVGMMLHPLRGMGDFARWNLMRLMPAAMWLAVLIAAWGFSRATPTFVAAANLVGLALLIVPFGALVTRRIPGPFTPDPQKFSAMLGYGLPCVMTSVPNLLNMRLDQMLMASLLPPLDLGLYAVAVAWSDAARPLLNAIGAVAMPSVAAASGQQEAARRLAIRSRMAVVVALPVCLAIAIATPFAVPLLFGPRYSGSILAALVLVPAATVLGSNAVLAEGLRGFGAPSVPLYAELAGLVVTVVGLKTMLVPFGIMGAALASLLGYAAVGAVLLFGARRITGVSVAALTVPRVRELEAAGKQMLGVLGQWLHRPLYQGTRAEP